MSVEHFEFGPFVLDAAAGTLTRDGLAVVVGHRGMALLIELLRAKHQPVSKAALMDAAWPGLAVEESNLSVQIAALRKLLGPTPTGGYRGRRGAPPPAPAAPPRRGRGGRAA